MKNILQSDDVDEFSGKFVAIHVTLPSYFGRKEEFPIIRDNSLLFAFIWNHKCNLKDGETGYDMSELLKKDVRPSIHTLINSKLSQVTMQMRLATDEELDIIRTLIKTKEAKFEYEGYKDSLIKIDDAINELTSNTRLHV
ncbi:hypothetical protein [Legionella sp.]|uniref:hypothetical protein n=1 Tax=Legionella sp. TaxID=459 RepID=UPI003C9E5CFA